VDGSLHKAMLPIKQTIHNACTHTCQTSTTYHMR